MILASSKEHPIGMMIPLLLGQVRIISFSSFGEYCKHWEYDPNSVKSISKWFFYKVEEIGENK